MRNFVLGVSIFLTAGCNSAQIAAERSLLQRAMNTALANYVSCMKQASNQLKSSEDSPLEIAIAAEFRCGQEASNYCFATASYFDSIVDTRYGQMRAQEASDRLCADTKRSGKELVVRAIVENRVMMKGLR